MPVSVARDGTCLGPGCSGKGTSEAALAEEVPPESAEWGAAAVEGGGEAGKAGTVPIVSVPVAMGAWPGIELTLSSLLFSVTASSNGPADSTGPAVSGA